MQVTKKLTEGNLCRNYLQYALPLILAAVLAQLYSTVDAVIAGKFIGDLALGAVSATASVESLLFALFNGFAAGFAIYLANLFGRKDYARIKLDTYSVVIFIAAVSLFLGGLLILLRNPILDYLKVDPLLREDAETYFILGMIGCVFNYVNRILGQVLPAMGVTSFTLYVSVGSAILNIIGNLVSVIVFDLGVAGLALSTVLANAVVTVFYLIMLRKTFKTLPMEKTPYRFRFAHVKRSLRYTLPTAAQQLAFHGVGVLIAPPINGMGAAATTAYTVSTRLYSISSITIWNLTAAISCYTAQCVGEGGYQKIRRGLRVGFGLNISILAPIMVTFFFLAEPIAAIFFPTGFEGMALDYAVRYVKIFMPFLVIQMADHILHAYLRSLGGVSAVFIISLCGSVVRAVTTFVMVPAMGMDGVYLSQIISWGADLFLTMILYLWRYRTEEHVKKIVHRLSGA